MGKAGGGNGARQNGGMSLYKMHRWIGLASAALFAVLAVTGPMLMHAKDFSLNEIWVTNDFALSFYDTDPAGPPRGVQTDAGWVLAVDGFVILEARLLGRDQGELIGAAIDGDYLVVAADSGLSLFTRDGAPVEHFGIDALPGPVLRLGQSADGLVIETPQGRFRSDDDYLSWREANEGDVAWVDVDENPPAEQSRQALDIYRRHLVTAHRLITDIHSGRIVGAWGPYVMDAAAVAMLLMVASGLVNWWKNRGRN